MLFLGQHQRFLSVAGAADVIILAFEVPDQKLGERPVVLDEEKLLAAHAPSSLCGGSGRRSPVAA